MSTFRAYLQLVRFPAVFTALADVALGFLLTHPTLLIDDCPLPFVLLLVSSSGLYLAGMAFNDVFDRKIDAQERPQRPIPSGRVPLRSAVILGGALIAVGLTAAGFAGVTSLFVALLLTAAIFLYDGVLKGTVLGPVMMGSCRFLNVLLGCSVGLEFSAVWSEPQVWVAGSVGAYIVGVTLFAREEAGESSSVKLALALLVLNAGLAGLIATTLYEPAGLAGRAPFRNVALAWGIVLLVINRGALLALTEPSPKRVQTAVKTMIQWLIMIDAVAVYAVSGNAVYALAVAVLLFPAMFLGRWIFVT